MATAVIKNELKYFPMSEGNACIEEPNLEVLPLIWFSKGLVQFLFVKSFLKKNGESSDDRCFPSIKVCTNCLGRVKMNRANVNRNRLIKTEVGLA